MAARDLSRRWPSATIPDILSQFSSLDSAFSLAVHSVFPMFPPQSSSPSPSATATITTASPPSPDTTPVSTGLAPSSTPTSSGSPSPTTHTPSSRTRDPSATASHPTTSSIVSAPSLSSAATLSLSLSSATLSSPPLRSTQAPISSSTPSLSNSQPHPRTNFTAGIAVTVVLVAIFVALASVWCIKQRRSRADRVRVTSCSDSDSFAGILPSDSHAGYSRDDRHRVPDTREVGLSSRAPNGSHASVVAQCPQRMDPNSPHTRDCVTHLPPIRVHRQEKININGLAASQKLFQELRDGVRTIPACTSGTCRLRANGEQTETDTAAVSTSEVSTFECCIDHGWSGIIYRRGLRRDVDGGIRLAGGRSRDRELVVADLDGSGCTDQYSVSDASTGTLPPPYPSSSSDLRQT